MCGEDRDNRKILYFDFAIIFTMRKISIKDWAADDQPRKKLVLKGPDSLSDAELLAILINTGTANQSALELAKNLLARVNNNLNRLSKQSVPELLKLKVKGLGEAKAITLTAALELGVRRAAAENHKTVITKSEDIALYLRAKYEYKQQEIFVVIFLNRANKIIHEEIVSAGGLTGTVADPRIILKKALEQEATALILCHNHPSGNLKPSKADELLTQKIKQAAALLDINVLDHIIVSQEGYFSFADEGML
jgi:DNA repair protein RadC